MDIRDRPIWRKICQLPKLPFSPFATYYGLLVSQKILLIRNVADRLYADRNSHELMTHISDIPFTIPLLFVMLWQ